MSREYYFRSPDDLVLGRLFSMWDGQVVCEKEHGPAGINMLVNMAVEFRNMGWLPQPH